MAVTQLLEHLMDTLEGIRMPTRFIHLDRMPRDEEGVAELHQALQKCQDGPLADGWGEVSHWSAERNEGELQVHLIAVLPRLSGSSLRG